MPVSFRFDRHFLFQLKHYLIHGSVIRNLRSVWNKLFLQHKFFNDRKWTGFAEDKCFSYEASLLIWRNKRIIELPVSNLKKIRLCRE